MVSMETPAIVKDDKMVHHPNHYIAKNGMEVIDVIEAFTANLTGIEATDTGNVIKYICRWKEKNGKQDLKKLIFYASHLINHLEKEEKAAELKKQSILVSDIGTSLASNGYHDRFSENTVIPNTLKEEPTNAQAQTAR